MGRCTTIDHECQLRRYVTTWQTERDVTKSPLKRFHCGNGSKCRYKKQQNHVGEHYCDQLLKKDPVSTVSTGAEGPV